jgi:hypothetical protein
MIHRTPSGMLGRVLPAAVALLGLGGRCNVTPFRPGHGDAALGTPGAGPDGSTGRGTEPDSAAAEPPPFSCGGVVCATGTSSVQSFPCCTDGGECGLRVVISPKCFPRNLKGGVDSRCAPFEIPGQITLPGCCSPSGCGALASFDQIGCIPNSDLGRATVDCVPDVPFQ